MTNTGNIIIDENSLQECMKRIMQRFDSLENKLDNVLPQKENIEDERLLDNQDLMLLLKVAPRTLQDYRTKGIIPYTLISGRVYYKYGDIKELLKTKVRKCDLMKWEKKRST